MNASACRTVRVFNLVRRLSECNLKYKGSYRNSNLIHKFAISVTNCACVNSKGPEFLLVRYACTLANGVLLNNPNVRKYLDNLLEEYKKYIGKNTGYQKELFEISGIGGLMENKMKLEENLKSLQELVSSNDKEITRLVNEEKEMYNDRLKTVEYDILQLLVPKEDFDDCSQIMLEITAGVGGQEAMLFAKKLFNMYSGYIQYKGWAAELADYESTDIGGVRYASLLISGQNAYQYLQLEGGVHRVQRVPSTEKSGRIHTSTVTVAVLPQPAEVDVVLHDKDLKIETKRASGAGGQHVNTTDSAVRITHGPTGWIKQSL